MSYWHRGHTAALDAGLCQPDEVRARLAGQSTKASQFVTRLWDTDSRGKVIRDLFSVSLTPYRHRAWRGSVQQGLSAAGGALGFFPLGHAADKRYSLNTIRLCASLSFGEPD
jgi:hypothetical protein